MSSDHSNDPHVEAPAPVNFNIGAVKGLLVAACALLLAVAAVLFFSVLQTTVPVLKRHRRWKMHTRQ
jgi:hypothetical protein